MASLSTPANAGCSPRDIARAFASVWKYLTQKRTPTIPGVSDPVVLKWFGSHEYAATIEARRAMGKLPTPTPTTLNFKGQTLKVILPLGAGSEGAVYLVETPEGVRAAKVLSGLDPGRKAESHRNQLGSFKLSGFNAPEVLGTDLERSLNLYEYVEGVPLDRVVDARLGLTGDHLPEILELREKFYAQIRREFPSFYGRLSTGFMDSNLVYSFREHRIYIVDPH